MRVMLCGLFCLPFAISNPRLWKVFTLEHIAVYQHFHWTLPCTANCSCRHQIAGSPDPQSPMWPRHHHNNTLWSLVWRFSIRIADNRSDPVRRPIYNSRLSCHWLCRPYQPLSRAVVFRSRGKFYASQIAFYFLDPAPPPPPHPLEHLQQLTRTNCFIYILCISSQWIESLKTWLWKSRV